MSTLDINNQKINYIIRGKPEHPPLVLVHGIFTDIMGYKGLITELTDKYRVYALDLPGHGASSKLTSKTNLATLLDDFVLKLNINKPTIVGHSAGAVLAVKYAATNPNIKELILLNPAGIKHYSEMSLLFKLFKNAYANKSSSKLKSRSKLDKLIIKKNIERNILNIEFWKQFFKLNKTDQSKDLQNIKCKTKIIWGNRDRLYSTDNIVEYSKNIKNHEIRFIEAGHTWPRKNPNLIKKHLWNK